MSTDHTPWLVDPGYVIHISGNPYGPFPTSTEAVEARELITALYRDYPEFRRAGLPLAELLRVARSHFADGEREL